MNNLIYCLMAACYLLLFSGCKPVEKTTRTNIKGKSPQFLLASLSENELSYQWFSAKLSTKITTDNLKKSFTVRLRIRKDSILWISVSSILTLGVEIARASINEDSIKFVNRINSTYFNGNLEYLNKLFQAEINYNMLQSILTGMSFSYPYDYREGEKSEKFKSSVDNSRYLLSTLGKRKLKKTMIGKKEVNAPIQRIWLDPITYKVSELEIKDLADKSEIKVSYEDFKEVDNQLFPHKITIDIRDEQTTRITLNYSKIIFNKPQKFPLKIPEKYEQVY